MVNLIKPLQAEITTFNELLCVLRLVKFSCNHKLMSSRFTSTERNDVVRAVAVTQLVERSHLTPEVRSSNPVISKLLNLEHLFAVNWIEKTKIKKNRPGNSH